MSSFWYFDDSDDIDHGVWDVTFVYEEADILIT